MLTVLPYSLMPCGKPMAGGYGLRALLAPVALLHGYVLRCLSTSQLHQNVSWDLAPALVNSNSQTAFPAQLKFHPSWDQTFFDYFFSLGVPNSPPSIALLPC